MQSQEIGYLGLAELADYLGVSRQRAYQLAQRRDFPEPVVRLAMGPVWRRSAIERFVERWPRKGGRQAKAAR